MCSHATRFRSCIMPPHILREIAQHGSPAQRAAATNTLALDATFRTLRASPPAVRPRSNALPAAVPVAKHRTIYTAAHQQQLPGQIVGTEQKPPTKASDVAAYEAFQGLGATLDFYFEGLRPPLDRRRGPAARRDRALRPGLQQRLLGRPADGLRRRRRRDLQPLHGRRSTSSATSSPTA